MLGASDVGRLSRGHRFVHRHRSLERLLKDWAAAPIGRLSVGLVMPAQMCCGLPVILRRFGIGRDRSAPSKLGSSLSDSWAARPVFLWELAEEVVDRCDELVWGVLGHVVA